MARLAALVACVAVGFLLFYAGARTPDPLPVSAPVNQFAAGRAMPDIAFMALAPHPMGSAANARVRDYLIGRMTGLGLSPRIQRGQGDFQRAFGEKTLIVGGDVENVIGVLPGRDPRLPALTLMAHYDSVPGSPGAADDITGVASVLEVVRAIKVKGVPERDVMVVFTDGEEAGLLGATVFFRDDPMASHVGFIMNLEARGGGGRATMFETGQNNGGAIDLYRRTAPRPAANSLTVFLYKHLSNDTDYKVPKAKGIAGLNYAFIGRQFDYHSPSSTVAALDQGSVQHIGEQVLSTARALAFASALPARTPDEVYGQVVGHLTLAYPAWGGWILLGGIALLMAVAAWRNRESGRVPWWDMAGGAGAGLLLLVGAAAALHLARYATGYGFGWMAGRPLLARFPTFEVAMALAGLGALMLIAAGLARGSLRIVGVLLALAIGLASSAFGGFDMPGLVEGMLAGGLALLLLGRPVGVFGGWMGLLSIGFLATLGLQIWAPTIAFTIGWPLAAGAASAALIVSGEKRRPAEWTLVLALSAVTLAWLGNLFHGFLQGLDVPELPALIVWLAAFCLWPLAWVRPDRAATPSAFAPGAAILAVGLGVALWLNVTDPYSPRHPRAVTPLYVVDHDGGRSWRVSPFKPDPWTRGVLGADGGAIAERAIPGFKDKVWAARAVNVAAAPPDISAGGNADGTVSLRARASADTSLELELKIDAPTAWVRLNGRPVTLATVPGAPIFIRWSAAPDGLVLTFKPTRPGVLSVTYAAYRRGWPAAAKPLPPLPAKMMAWDMFGSTVMVGTTSARW